MAELAIAARPAPIEPEVKARYDALIAVEAAAARARYDGPVTPLVARPTVFPHVCDGGAALASHPADETCACCRQRAGRWYVLTVDQPSPGLPTGRDVAICDVCVLAGRARFHDARAFETYCARAFPELSSERRHAIAAAIASELDRTPPVVPWSQEPDWPACCGGPSAYLGSPANLASLVALAPRWYERGRIGEPDDLGELASGESSWDDVHVFACTRCGQHYFVWQVD
jgi:hypothetical protein